MTMLDLLRDAPPTTDSTSSRNLFAAGALTMCRLQRAVTPSARRISLEASQRSGLTFTVIFSTPCSDFWT